MEVIQTQKRKIPTKQEAEVLRAFAFGMSVPEIALSMDKTVLDVGRDVGSLIQTWHNLEQSVAQRRRRE